MSPQWLPPVGSGASKGASMDPHRGYACPDCERVLCPKEICFDWAGAAGEQVAEGRDGGSGDIDSVAAPARNSARHTTRKRKFRE